LACPAPVESLGARAGVSRDALFESEACLMSTGAVSLLDRESQQLDLMSSADIPAHVFERDGRVLEYTAERYKRDHPTEYRWACALLFGDSLSISRVSQMLQASRNTIAAIYERESQSVSVEQVKREAVAEFRMLRRLSRDRLRDYLLHLPDAADLLRREGGVEKIAGLIHKIGIIMGIATDKEQLLGGQATARIEVGRPARDAYEDLMQAAREAAQKMGFAVDGAAAKGAGAAGSVGVDVADQAGAGADPAPDLGMTVDAEWTEGTSDE